MSTWAEHTGIKSSKNENESTPRQEISDNKTIIPNLNKDENQKVEDFLNLLKEHQEHPLEAYMGPTLKEFNLSKSPIGLVGKAEKGMATLYIFNWNKEPVTGMSENPELSQRMGRKVYELKNINTQNIDSQQGTGEILGFTYLQGARFPVPLPFNENYFDKKHPLRVALGAETMPIYSPDETPIRKLFPTESFYRKQFPKGSGNVFFETFIHESFHVIEGDRNREENPPYGKTTGSYSDEDTLKEVNNKPEVFKLLQLYKKEVFKITSIPQPNPEEEKMSLSKIEWCLNELKSKYPETYKMLRHLEYAEGAADFVKHKTVLSMGIKNLGDLTNEIQNEKDNAFFYHTGSLGLLKINQLGESIDRDRADDESIWEIYIKESNIKTKEIAGNPLDNVVDNDDVNEIKKSILSYVEETNKIN